MDFNGFTFCWYHPNLGNTLNRDLPLEFTKFYLSILIKGTFDTIQINHREYIKSWIRTKCFRFNCKTMILITVRLSNTQCLFKESLPEYRHLPFYHIRHYKELIMRWTLNLYQWWIISCFLCHFFIVWFQSKWIFWAIKLWDNFKIH